MGRGASFRSSDMHILVTGASGFVGTVLCRELLARGHAVRAALRRRFPPSVVPPQLQQILVPDIGAEFDRRALVDGVDTVVHLAAIAHRSKPDDGELRRVNCDAAVRLAEAAAGSVRRFVFLSSAKVHGEDSGSGTYTEDDALDPQDSYGRSKLEAERALTDTAARCDIELVIVRPPLVYGPEVRANFLRLLGRPARLLPVPPALLRMAGMIAGRRDDIRRLTGNLAIDSLRARRLLDWRPPYTLDAGLAQTARWFRSARA